MPPRCAAGWKSIGAETDFWVLELQGVLVEREVFAVWGGNMEWGKRKKKKKKKIHTSKTAPTPLKNPSPRTHTSRIPFPAIVPFLPLAPPPSLPSPAPILVSTTAPTQYPLPGLNLPKLSLPPGIQFPSAPRPPCMSGKFQPPSSKYRTGGLRQGKE